MFLSSLEILGFKSFARKTVFRFPEGITAIVGPNGCGKTNVVDAIRWVLGEQRAGILRSERMENVIFNGSSSAPALGMAEVSITLQNTRNILPIEFSEVKVTRRLFRSGESQYLLNDAPCRLKDIQNLFMDTGLAPDAYSVIELAMVEQILNGRADERRRILEEAAGVGKYKVRRKAAFRKLEATEADLLRLNDLIGEVERNVRSLQVQVRRAERVRELRQELREKDLLLASAQLRQVQQELEPLETRLRELRRERDRLHTQIELEESELEQLRVEMAEAENRLREAQQTANQRTAHARSLERRLLVLRERMRSTEDSLRRIERELTELEVRSQRIAQERETLRQKMAAAEKRCQEVDLKLERADQERQKAQRAYDAAKSRLAEAEKELSEQERQFSGLEVRKEKILARQDATQRQLEQLRRRLASLRDEAEKLRRDEDLQTASLCESESTLETWSSRTNSLRKELELARSQLNDLQKKELRLTSELETAKQQLQTLERLLETYEDRPEGLRYLLTSSEMKEKLHGLFTDRIAVDEDLAQAIAAALGPAAHSLVVGSLNAALKGIEALRNAQKGTASFVAADRTRQRRQEKQPLAGDGVVGWANELVRCAPEDRPLVDALLGGVVVVENEEAALRLLERENPPSAIVTRGGTLFRPDGLVQGGYHSSDSEDLFDRQTKVENLRERVATLARTLEQVSKEREKTEQEVERLSSELVESEARLAELDREANRKRLNLGQIQQRLSELAVDIAETEKAASDLEREAQALAGSLQTLENEAAAVGHTLERNRARLAEIKLHYEERENELKVSEGSFQQVRLEKVRATTEFESLKAQVERLERERTEVQELSARRQAEQDELQKRLESTRSTIGTVEADLNRALERKDAADSKVEAAQRAYTELRNRISQREDKLRHLREDQERCGEEIHEIELRVSELRMRAEHIRARAREAWNADPVAQAETEVDVDELQAEVQKLRERLERMGPVNDLAIEEYAREKERLDFLTSQRDDLLKAKQNLLQTIEQINRTARERFLSTFETVRKNFTTVFQSFFEGGEADLRLADPRDPLESEIEILARPRGKKVETLSLLSGGEKALTALSFLFAIYLVKPSPFCILDEVDAPLDDNNVENFIRALRKFSENTQFIVVTHNKLTMKAADALYGVTMQRDGVSKVVSVRFEEELVENAA